MIIRLELEPVGNSVRGRAVVDAAGSTREFAGWMSLVAVLDQLLRGEEPRQGSPERLT